MPEIIVLAGQPNYPPEKIAAAAITPGHLVEVVPSGGDAGQLRVHATAAGDAAPYFAIQSLVPSLSTSQTHQIDLAYADGDSVSWVIGHTGDMIYAWVPASATAIKDGDQLVSNGDGTLKKYVAQASNEGGSATYTIQQASVVARAAEDKDNSGGGSAARIRVRVV
jgi:hypothetical protein